MIIMTEKKFQEKMQKLQEEQWRMEREAKCLIASSLWKRE